MEGAIVSGILFVAVLFAVEWPFANFLMAKASANRFFGTIYFDYNSRPGGFDRGRRFFQPEWGTVLWWALVRASVYAMLSTWLGLAFGRWMREVKREVCSPALSSAGASGRATCLRPRRQQRRI